MSDSVVDDGQSIDSPVGNGEQPSPEGRTAAELEAEVRDLRSRLGRQIQVSGEEKRAIEQAYKEWQANYQGYFTGEIEKRDAIISGLEQELITKLDSEGARVVIESRDAREAAERQQRAEQEDRARRMVQELEDAKQEALAVYPTVTAEELANVRTARAVWAAAARIDREKSKPAEAPAPVQRQVREPDPESRVPTPTSTAPRTAQSRQVTDAQAQIDELEKQRREFIRRGRLAEAMGLSRQILQLRQE